MIRSEVEPTSQMISSTYCKRTPLLDHCRYRPDTVSEKRSVQEVCCSIQPSISSPDRSGFRVRLPAGFSSILILREQGKSLTGTTQTGRSETCKNSPLSKYIILCLSQKGTLFHRGFGVRGRVPAELVLFRYCEKGAGDLGTTPNPK